MRLATEWPQNIGLYRFVNRKSYKSNANKARFFLSIMSVKEAQEIEYNKLVLNILRMR